MWATGRSFPTLSMSEDSLSFPTCVPHCPCRKAVACNVVMAMTASIRAGALPDTATARTQLWNIPRSLWMRAQLIESVLRVQSHHTIHHVIPLDT